MANMNSEKCNLEIKQTIRMDKTKYDFEAKLKSLVYYTLRGRFNRNQMKYNKMESSKFETYQRLTGPNCCFCLEDIWVTMTKYLSHRVVESFPAPTVKTRCVAWSGRWSPK